ncbi:MAG: RNA polymerase sigma factor RpoH [Deltaproteobacteria bacterium]|jgi:RNA polymerase sigma-32 factor
MHSPLKSSHATFTQGGPEALKLPVVTGTLDLYITEINRFPLLTAEEEFKLAVRLKKYNDMEAAEKLIVSNLRFVVKIAHEYRNYGFKLADLIQEGNIGLIHAVKKFDPYKGYRLISYAVWWIRAYIQNYVIKSWSIVKIGTTQAQRKLFFKLSQAKKQLETLSKKNPEFSEIADSLGVKGSEVAEMDLRLGTRDLSLNEFISDEGDTSHLDFLTHDGDDQETSLIKHEERSLVKRDIAGALAKLNERESYIIRNRVMADNPMTLQEIGDKYNITRERARQIEKQALRKVQLALPYLKPDN